TNTFQFVSSAKLCLAHRSSRRKPFDLAQGGENVAAFLFWEYPKPKIPRNYSGIQESGVRIQNGGLRQLTITPATK
ncbi:MAG: hypothetical protein WCI20_13995, partial [bacterium]